MRNLAFADWRDIQFARFPRCGIDGQCFQCCWENVGEVLEKSICTTSNLMERQGIQDIQRQVEYFELQRSLVEEDVC